MQMERVRIGVIACVALLAFGGAQAQEAPEAPVEPGERVRGYVPPPTDLELVDGHWTPYDPPAPPEGAQVHVVQPGDTLWDLAETYYEEPYLWPIIWDQNRYVTYSHWIYPGDPLVVPPKPMQVTEEGVEEEVEPEVEAEPEEDPVEVITERPTPEVPFQRAEEEAEPKTRRPPSLVPAAEEQELLCSSQLYERFDPSPLTIAGREDPDKELQSEGDIVYFSAGRDLGIEPGAEYVVIRAADVVEHPVTGEDVAVLVRRLGRVRAIAVHPSSTTAEVRLSCDAMLKGDYLVPYREMPIPMVERIPINQLASPFASGEVATVISMSRAESRLAGSGDMVGIDLGHRGGLTAGDRVLFFRANEMGPEEPRRVLAQGVVVSTQGGGSTVKILESRSEVLVGDQAEIL